MYSLFCLLIAIFFIFVVDVVFRGRGAGGRTFEGRLDGGRGAGRGGDMMGHGRGRGGEAMEAFGEPGVDMPLKEVLPFDDDEEAER